MTSVQAKFDLAHFLPYRLTVVADHLSKGLARRYRSEYGITVPEWRVLVHLNQAGVVSVRDIERRVGLEKSRVSRAASKLENDGYISKAVHSGDRRLVELTLTGKGKALMGELVPLAVAYQDQLVKILGRRLDGLEASIDLLLESNV